MGHWEGDLVVGAGATGYPVTLVERVTRFTLTGWSKTREADEVAGVVIRLLAVVGIACTGITFDNGREFARHGEIASALKADVFFPRPSPAASAAENPVPACFPLPTPRQHAKLRPFNT